MHPDDDSQTTLSKWPFILGDILLVATALAIGILDNWQLTNWQVGACVAAVALGAAFFVLPYIVEYQVRVGEVKEGRAADLRSMEKHMLSAEQALDSLDARMRALEGAAANADAPYTELAESLDKQLSQFEAARVAQQEAISALQEHFKKLAAEEPPAPLDPEVLIQLEERLKALESRPTPEAKVSTAVVPKPPPAPAKPSLKGAVKKPAPEPEPRLSEEKPTPEPESIVEEPEPETKEVPKPQKQIGLIERPKREARERHRPEESRLLKRAITEKGDKSSAAVSRIIESKAKEKELPAKASAETEKPEPKAAEPEKKVSTVEAPKEEPLQPEKPEPELSQAEKSKVEGQDDSLDLDAEVPAMDSSDMLFDDEEVSSPLKKVKARKNDAVITAAVFIGIGNKPYLRGSGAGLSWEKGVLMEFQEIGKWRWVAPSETEEPLELQIYRNDEDADKSGKYTLEPGQKLEVSPVF
ncbi:MAG: hypothetical protein ACPGSB_00330 [Opitutales bacterium]